MLILISGLMAVVNFVVYQKEVIAMSEVNQDLLVLEEGVKAGIVRGCCTSGPAKI